MHPLLLMVLVFGGYMLMYRFYGRFISRRIFSISSTNKVPSETMNDGFDYVPTKKEIISVLIHGSIGDLKAILQQKS